MSIDDAVQVVGIGDLAAQLRRAYANIAELLDRFGATMDPIVDETLFVIDIGGVMPQNQGRCFRSSSASPGPSTT